MRLAWFAVGLDFSERAPTVVPRLRGVVGLAEEWALAVDRIAPRLGEPQRFGTRARGMPDGALVVLSVTDPDRGARRRAALGLPSWSAYLADFDAGDTLPLLDCTDAPVENVPAKLTDCVPGATDSAQDAVNRQDEVKAWTSKST